ncbi:glycosyltransferase [Flavobacterium cucumis]|uniref:Glycosyltransferase involved in cell wall bisynthesis n=1 Tax=Flavobacterium cucumis TaxID=416016 RepID=A0A1M7ZU79_9FLAO|nr:glycosyltransferase [Flavobacterium cucumis]SHO72435.1 Glycosyltransferase involved in cell wall bisynthesis [Flavobacterium cucumis]
MSQIKIAHILHSVGGVDVSLRFILKNIDDDKFENIIIHGYHDTNHNFFNKKNKKLVSYKVPIERNISFFKDITSVFQTYKILKSEKPQIIHAHSAKGGVIGRFLGFILGINVLYTPQAFSYLSSEIKFKKFLFLQIEKFLITKSNYLLASSNSERLRAINEVGYKKNNVILFNNSIQEVLSIKQLSIDKTWPNKYICTVGRPSYQKNIELMIRVVNEVRKEQNIHLVIMGVGHHSDRLSNVQKLIQEYGLSDAVTLIDWTERENIFNIISNSKLYISTSRYEGLPYSVIESLALGKPCIVSDCDGNRDLITNGYNGFVIKDENIEEFSEKIKLVFNDEVLSKKLSENAKKSFDEDYNIEKNILKLQEIYSKYAIKN